MATTITGALLDCRRRPLRTTYHLTCQVPCGLDGAGNRTHTSRYSSLRETTKNQEHGKENLAQDLPMIALVVQLL